MKRITAVLCAAAMLFSLAACSKAEDYSNQNITGQVTAIDGNKITLQLGELKEQDMSQTMENNPDGEQQMEGQDPGQTPPEIPEGEQQAEGQEPGQTPPDKPEEEQQPEGQNQGQTPPEIPEGEQQPEGQNQGQTPPEIPEGEQQAEGQEPGQAPPEIPEGEQQAEGQEPDQEPGQAPPDNGNGMPAGGDMKENSFTAGDESVTLDFDGAAIKVEEGAETIDGTIEDISVDSILVVEVGDKNMVKIVTVKYIGKIGSGFGGSGEVTQGTSANTIDSDGEYSESTYTSIGDNENALRVDKAAVTLNGITVDKSAGASSNTEDGDFYGMNAALLATNGAIVTLRDSTITSSAQNGNGVFSYGNGTTVHISDSRITTTGDNSGGIQTTGGGTTNAENLTIETSGNSAAAIRSDRGGGTVNADGGSYTTNGYNSPAVYSTAAITVKNADLTANHSEALVIEGKNSITLTDCNVTGNMSDTEGSSSDENVHNVMIYQSMSGDADIGTSEFSMSGGKLISNNGDMIYVTNTHSIIRLSEVEIINQDAEGYLLHVAGNSASRGWGSAGNNGGQIEFTADHQTLEGNIIVDSISTLDMTLTGNSNFTGTINIVENAQDGAAVSDNAVITVDSGSIWTLTGDCTITSLENKGTINFNGYSITLADGSVLKQ